LEGGGARACPLILPRLYSLAGAAASVSKVETAAAINAEYGLAGDAAITDGVISSLGESVVRARLRPFATHRRRLSIVLDRRATR
jgi:hypothetical protein